MSFENTHCPCGGQKPTDTMLCPECETAFADRYERKDMDNNELPVDVRRNAAIILITLARGRRRQRTDH